MKNAHLILLILFIFFLRGKFFAQTHLVTSGIYLTANDLRNNHLIEEEECKKDHEEFKKHDFFSKQTFDVIYKGKKTTFQKNQIFAYRDCDNKTWRFYENKEYEILEKLDIYIYKLSKVVLNGMTVEKDPVFYFSHGIDGDIKELTNDNLKAVFKTNAKFCNLVDKELTSEIPDKATHAYDFEHKMYKVNYLLLESKKKK
jgi:hypothetical protein